MATTTEKDPPTPPAPSRPSVYDKFSRRKKRGITAIVSLGAFLGPLTSSSFLPSIPQIAHDVHCSAAVIGYTVAVFLFTIGAAPLIWAPLSGFYGRKAVYLMSLPIFVLGSIGVANSHSVGAIMATRVLQGIGSSSVLACGAGTVGDIYAPVERARAMGWYYSGATLGPALAPVLAGVFQEYTPATWRSMQYCLAGFGVLALVLVALFLPETSHGGTLHARLCSERDVKFIPYWFNPFKSILLLRWPNVLTMSLNSSAIIFTTYAVLVPLSTVFENRYHITNAAILGCLYLPSGVGNVIGTRFAGVQADKTVKKWMEKRGYRRPEDRLHATIISSAFLTPASLLAVGWLVQSGAGGLGTPLVFYAINGFSLMLVLNPANVYLVDSAQTRSAEAIAVNNFLRYSFSAGASAAVLPMIDAIGIGWTNTIAAFVNWIGTALILVTIRYGSKWREAANERYGVTYKEDDEIHADEAEVQAAVPGVNVELEDKAPMDSVLTDAERQAIEAERHDEPSSTTPKIEMPVRRMPSRRGDPLPDVSEVLRRTQSHASAHH